MRRTRVADRVCAAQRVLQVRQRGGEGGDELRRGGLVERGLAECAECRQRSPVRLITQPLRLAQQVRKHAHGASESGVVQRAAQRSQVLGGGDGNASLLYAHLLGPVRVACEHIYPNTPEPQPPTP